MNLNKPKVFICKRMMEGRYFKKYVVALDILTFSCEVLVFGKSFDRTRSGQY